MSSGQKRSQVKKLRFTDAELDELRKRVPVEARFASWARSRFLDEPVAPERTRLSREAFTALLQLARIGNNLNQLTRAINTLVLTGQILSNAEDVQISLLELAESIDAVTEELLKC
jgi:hypothetical protein